ncbi:hypothetical protein COOONC_04870 [Cooperia oncophora]
MEDEPSQETPAERAQEGKASEVVTLTQCRALAATADNILLYSLTKIISTMPRTIRSKRNKDPVIAHMLTVLSEKIPGEFSSHIESEKRCRSIVISGISESPETYSHLNGKRC